MAKTITVETTLNIVTCSCGLVFAVPDQFLDARRDDHKTFYCPNGHGHWFPEKNDLEEAQAEIDKYKRLYLKERQYSASVREERNAAQKQLSATKGQVTKLKKRITGGVCPCCHRTFVQLARHMENKHPEYAMEEQAT